MADGDSLITIAMAILVLVIVMRTPPRPLTFWRRQTRGWLGPQPKLRIVVRYGRVL